MRMVRAAAVLSIFGLALIAAVLVIRDDAKRVSLGSVASFWGTGAPGWWSKIPVVGGSGLPAVKFDGIPVEGLASPPMQRQAVVVHAAPPYHAWYVRHTGVCRNCAATCPPSSLSPRACLCVLTFGTARGTKPHDDYVGDVVRAVPALRAGVRAVAGTVPQRAQVAVQGQKAGKIEFDGIPLEGLPAAPAAQQQQPVAVHIAPPYHAWSVIQSARVPPP